MDHPHPTLEGGRLSAGLDMMLVPSARDHGLGPLAARLLIAHLVRHRGWHHFTGGFVVEHPWPDHPDGPALLTRLVDPASAGPD